MTPSVFPGLPSHRTALVCYLMGGDGDTAALLQAVDEAGADVIELGLPFSDPIADGPVLQAAARALWQPERRSAGCWPPPASCACALR